jgi:hypothetical protein
MPSDFGAAPVCAAAMAIETLSHTALKSTLPRVFRLADNDCKFFDRP